MKVLPILSLGILCCTAWSAEPVRLSMPEMLNPETRLRTYYDYRMRVEPERMKSTGNAEFEEFAHFHGFAPLKITEVPGAKDGLHYLIFWQSAHGLASGEPWPDEMPESRPEFRPLTDGGYRLFAADGKPLSEEVVAFHSVVLDVDGDGIPEVLEQLQLPPFVMGERKEPFTDYELLKVSRLDAEASPSFVLLYNANPPDRHPGNLWGSQVRVRKDGTTEIELGPVRLPGGIGPKAVFRWDKVQRAWVGPEHRPDDHWLILEGPWDEKTDWDRVAAAAGLHYPLAEPPEAAAEFVRPIPPAEGRVAPPYKAQSLASFSDGQIWSYMTGGRAEWDERYERERASMALPDLWQGDPKAAALAYVRRHRDLETREQYTTTIPTPEEAAPEKGDLTLSTSPLGDGPYVATLHHVHFAADGSFLLRLVRFNRSTNIPVFDCRDHWSVQRLDLTREQARRLFQTVWWMSRIRSQRFTSEGGQGGFHGGDHDSAVVTLQSPGKAATFQVRDGDLGSDFGPATFARLTALLFDQHVPEWLGEAWPVRPVRMANREGLPVPQSAEELIEVRGAMAGVLRLFVEGKVGRPLAEQAVTAVGEEGWRDLRGAVEQVREALPPLLPFERRTAEIDAQLKQWRTKLGKEASDDALLTRYLRRMEAQSQGPGENAKPLTPEEEKKFAEVDALYREKSDLSNAATTPEQELAELRAAIGTTLRQLEVFEDSKALLRWHAEEPFPFIFAMKRLVHLDPKGAVELLRRAEAASEGEHGNPHYDSDRRLLEERQERATAAPGARLTNHRRAELLESLRDPARIYREREHALYMLVPPEEPRRYPEPEIDAALLESLRRAETMEPEHVPLALAQRAGGKAWQPLSEAGTLAAHVLVAQHEPEKYRAQMSEAIAHLLAERKHSRPTICWALWQLDLRELQRDLELLATNGPEDVEGPFSQRRDELEPERQRLHLARHIAALWNETDPLARARMLVAFAVGYAETFAVEYNGALEHLARQLAAVRSELAPAQLATVAAYITWCERAEARRGRAAAPVEESERVVARLRAGLASAP